MDTQSCERASNSLLLIRHAMRKDALSELDSNEVDVRAEVFATWLSNCLVSQYVDLRHRRKQNRD